MAQRPSDASPYTYGARTLIRDGGVTELPYVARAAPDVVAGSVPTILRSFGEGVTEPLATKNGTSSRPPAPRSVMRATPAHSRETTPASAASRAVSPAATISSYAPSPPPSPTPSCAGGRENTPVPSSSCVPSARTSVNFGRATSVPTIHFASTGPSSKASSSAGPNVLTRSASRSSLRGDGVAAVPPGAVPMTSAGTPIRCLPQNPNPTTGIGYKRVEALCRQTYEEKARNVRNYTVWFPSWGLGALSMPPSGLSKRRDLKIGDLFCHWTPVLPLPQMWLWTQASDDRLQWQSVDLGFERDVDRRLLSIADNGEPQWITEGWAYSKKRKREANEQKKGKARDKHLAASAPKRPLLLLLNVLVIRATDTLRAMVNFSTPSQFRAAEDPFCGGQFVVEEPGPEARRQVRFAQDSSPVMKLSPHATTTSPSRLGPNASPSSVQQHPTATKANGAKSPRSRRRTSRSFCIGPILLFLLYVAIALVAAIAYRPALGRTILRLIAAYAETFYETYRWPFPSYPPSQLSPQLARHIDEAVHDSMLRLYAPRDYALASDGASIVAMLTSGGVPSVVDPTAKASSHPAHVLLRDNSHGGRCWEMEGANGQVGILLGEHVRPSHIAVDFVPPLVAHDPAQAPRFMRLWGALDGRSNRDRYQAVLLAESGVRFDGPPIAHTFQYVHLADLEYDINARQPSQTFPVDQRVRDMQLSFGVVVLEFLDNWGANVTCVYRIRIHGEPYTR